jgi:hypothetical protein
MYTLKILGGVYCGGIIVLCASDPFWYSFGTICYQRLKGITAGIRELAWD